MLGLLLLAMLATTSPTDPGIASPGLDSRTPVQSAELRDVAGPLQDEDPPVFGAGTRAR